MLRSALIPALATGLFCSIFAGVLDLATEMLTMVQVMIWAAVSGFLGSLFAKFVLKRGRKGAAKPTGDLE